MTPTFRQALAVALPNVVADGLRKHEPTGFTRVHVGGLLLSTVRTFTHCALQSLS